MQEMEIISLMEQTGAYQRGHFKLSSGLHSGAYVQCALLLANPIISARLAGTLAKKFVSDQADVVIGPALGGIVLAYEMARSLGARSIFAERDTEGKMALRRGFLVTPDSRVIISEDVLTTGQSINEVIELLSQDGVKPVGIACLVDRHDTKPDFDGIKFESLIKLNIPVFHEVKCPLCKEGLPFVKPGSRR